MPAPTYIGQLPAERVVQGVATSATLFLGRTAMGPTGSPTPISSLADFAAAFGAVTADFPVSLAVRDFFTNGGVAGHVVRVGGETPLAEADWLSAVDALPLDLVFNIFCVTPDVLGQDVPLSVVGAASALCAGSGAMAILPAPAAWRAAYAAGQCDQISADSFSNLPLESRFAAAAYFPDILAPDPVTAAPLAYPPCGAAAGLWAVVDSQVGVWRAPAGVTVGLLGVLGPEAPLTDAQQAAFNPNGVNGIRQFPNYGTVLWGARTLAGVAGETDARAYIAGARLLSYVRRSLTQGLAWTVFEPSGPALWASMTASATDFLQTLWQAGGLAGGAPGQAFVVTCDASTNPPESLAEGVVTMIVAIAIKSPAEFSLLELQFMAASPS